MWMSIRKNEEQNGASCDCHPLRNLAAGRDGSGVKRMLLLALLVFGLGIPSSDAQPTKEITIEAMPGLKYSRARFHVEPEATVKLTLKNIDEMMHNLVITQPGARLEVVNEAMRLGAEGPESEYVPESEAVLHATPVLNPDGEHTLVFTAPSTDGVYPYVCTFPGHGFVMYGAMYVSKTESMPQLSNDPNIPSQATTEDPATEPNVDAPPHRARVLREFMPNCGPAAIAVSLPGDQNYCWDAGACQFRYAWQGKFVDLGYQKKDGPAKILGDTYYTAGSDLPLRPGDASHIPEVEFLGYRLIDSFPEFHYKIDGIEVRELIQLRPDGPGLVRHFKMATPDQPVWFVGKETSDAVTITATQGTWKGDRLKLSPKEAEEFAISIAIKE